MQFRPAHLALMALLAMSVGCHVHRTPQPSLVDIGAAADVPRELCKTSLPTYRIEPPDVLLIDSAKVVPRPPYVIEPLDLLGIDATGTYPDHPIAGTYAVNPNGTVNLGPAYGTVRIVGLGLDEAGVAIRDHLSQFVRQPQVTVNLLESTGRQQIAGEHLVGPDGTVNLGLYGSVYVTGMTLQEAKATIEAHLEQYLVDPEVAVDVFSYNSKMYYVITEGGGYGDAVVRFPATGNETVLDAISNINGLQSVSSKKIWIARPVPQCHEEVQILPVDYVAITKFGKTDTNYQVLPGDRVFIAEDRLVAFHSVVDKMISPFERMFGFTLLGTQTIQTVNRFPRGFGNGVSGFGSF